MYIFPKQMKFWYFQIKSINTLVWTKLGVNRKKRNAYRNKGHEQISF